jgi:hypothetical protein
VAPGPQLYLTFRYRLLRRDGHAVHVRDEATVNFGADGRFLDGLFADEPGE